MENISKYEINEVFKDRETFLDNLREFTKIYYGKSLEDTNNIQKYLVLSKLINTCVLEDWRKSRQKTRDEHTKQLYYFSLEFLLGKMLKNNLRTLGIYSVVNDGLHDINIELSDIENIEEDINLGYSEKGSVAASLLDSLSALEFPGSGSTIRYKNGMFKQAIINNEQVELPDQWLKLSNPWEVRRADKAVEINFYGDLDMTRDKDGNLEYHVNNPEKVLAIPYDMPIVGNELNYTNTLRMWSAECSNEMPKGIDYRKYIQDVENICVAYHPYDSSEEGIIQKIKQEYFFVSASLQSIIKEHIRVYGSIDGFSDKVAIHLNDTNVSFAIPELIRLLVDVYNVEWEKAWDITTHVFSFTCNVSNKEELEKWPIDYVKKILPRIYLIIKQIDTNFRKELQRNGYKHDFVENVAIITEESIRMVSLCLYGSYSVNGVSKTHYEYMINDMFPNFYQLYPKRFNTKANGVSHRKWLFNANEGLCNVIEKFIGADFKKDIKKITFLDEYVNKQDIRQEYLTAKNIKKEEFAKWLRDTHNITIDIDSIFDVTSRSIDPDKRHIMAIFYIISLFFKIKEERTFTKEKISFIFTGKAASNDEFSKKIIKLINAVAEKINNDPDVNRYIKVIYIPDFSTTTEEKLLPAADVCEQITVAGKEPSGITNMKAMMSGAITFGTYDGANVDIRKLIGETAILIFGLHEDEISLKRIKGYNAYDIYKTDLTIHRIIDSLTDGTWSDDKNDFKLIYDEFILNNDEKMILADFPDYIKGHDKVFEFCKDKNEFAQKCLVNIAKCASFSSDRAIKEYASDIWKLKSFKKDLY